MVWRGRRKLRDGWWLALAIALHGSFLGLVRAVVGTSSPALSGVGEPLPRDRDEQALEIEFDGQEVPKLEEGPAETTPPNSRPAFGRAERAGLAPIEEPLVEGEAVANLEPSLGAPSDNTPPTAAGATPSQPIDFGIGADAWQRWLPRDSAGDGVARGETPAAPRSGRYGVFHAPPASTTGGVQEGLEARSRALGLGPSGRVISAFHRAARGREAPTLGNARFYVTVTESGAVEVALGPSSEPKSAWESLAARAAADIRKSPPRLPNGRAGVRLVIELVAEETLVGGAKTKDLHGPRLEVSKPRLQSTEQSKAELADRNPTAGTDAVPLADTKANADIPGVYLAKKGKVCDVRLGAIPLGAPDSGSRTRNALSHLTLQGGCEPSNIGSRPQRVVRVTSHDEVLF